MAKKNGSGRRNRRINHETRRTTQVDVQVGLNVRRRRIELGKSQTELATSCGITFQQVQKYENGANRVSASRLWQFAAVLGVPLQYFFEGLGQPKNAAGPAVRPSKAERSIDDETAKIARQIASLTDEKLKKRLKTMVAAIAAPDIAAARAAA